MPFAVTVRCSVSIRGMLPLWFPPVQVSGRHPAKLPGVADRQAVGGPVFLTGSGSTAWCG
jgi:hypothetical protein